MNVLRSPLKVMDILRRSVILLEDESVLQELREFALDIHIEISDLIAELQFPLLQV